VVSKALEERGIRAEKLEACESCRFNLKVEMRLGNPCRFSSDYLSHITRRVAETGLRR